MANAGGTIFITEDVHTLFHPFRYNSNLIPGIHCSFLLRSKQNKPMLVFRRTHWNTPAKYRRLL
jgi:hypothetical protein